MVSLYQSDFAASGGFDLTLQGWGGEDIHLVTNFILRGKVIFLLHIFNKNKFRHNQALNLEGTYGREMSL